MRVRKIVIIGNSVALRNRPHVKMESKNYGQIIEEHLNSNTQEKLILVNNLGVGSATMHEINAKMDDIINAFGDLYIINAGVVDATNREIPFWFARIMKIKRDNILSTIAKGIHKYFILSNRRLLVKLRGKKSWVSKKTFAKKYDRLLDTITRNTSGKVICMSINIPNDRVESIVPGTRLKYHQYNQIISSLAQKHELHYLNFDDLDSKTYYPDGVHFNQEGNKLVAQRILATINQNQLL